MADTDAELVTHGSAEFAQLFDRHAHISRTYRGTAVEEYASARPIAV